MVRMVGFLTVTPHMHNDLPGVTELSSPLL
jgi:hypothetical protein